MLISNRGSDKAQHRNPHVFLNLSDSCSRRLATYVYIINGKHPVIRCYVLFRIQRYGMFLENQIRP